MYLFGGAVLWVRVACRKTGGALVQIKKTGWCR